MAKHLCHIGRSTEGVFFLVRVMPDMTNNERLIGILMKDIPFFLQAIQGDGSSAVLKQAF